MKRILAILVICVMSSSCLTAMLLSEVAEANEMESEKRMSDISKSVTPLSLKVIQSYYPIVTDTFTLTSALAHTYNYDIVLIASIEEHYYDGYKTKGQFTRIGTYNYTTRQGVAKTVPVFVKSVEYDKNPQMWTSFGETTSTLRN